jgi:predicted RNase H-like HicB family nuclease
VHPDGRKTVVWQHNGDIPFGTLKQIEKQTLYPVIVHKDAGSDFGVMVPDFPVLFSGGETLEDALSHIQAALETFYEGEEDIDPPTPSTLDSVMLSEAAQGGGDSSS